MKSNISKFKFINVLQLLCLFFLFRLLTIQGSSPLNNLYWPIALENLFLLHMNKDDFTEEPIKKLIDGQMGTKYLIFEG